MKHITYSNNEIIGLMLFIAAIITILPIIEEHTLGLIILAAGFSILGFIVTSRDKGVKN